MKYLIIILSALSAANALIAIKTLRHFSPGNCSSIAIKSNFDYTKMLGKWYETEEAVLSLRPPIFKCTTLEISAPQISTTSGGTSASASAGTGTTATATAGTAITTYSYNSNAITFKRKSLLLLSNTPLFNNGTLKLNTVPSLAQLSATFLFPDMLLSGKYNILATDYVTYAVMERCIDVGVGRMVFPYIYTRERFPSLITRSTAHKVLRDNKILDFLVLQPVNHLFCPAGY